MTRIEVKDKTKERVERLVKLGFYINPEEVVQYAVEALYYRLLTNDFALLIASESGECSTINGLQNLDLSTTNEE